MHTTAAVFEEAPVYVRKEFLTHNDTDVNINGTSLQGYIQISYDDLVLALGEPTEGDGYKTDAEWYIEFNDGTVATVYNWKNGFNYSGGYGSSIYDIGEWHVGGHSTSAVLLVRKLLGEKTNGVI